MSGAVRERIQAFVSTTAVTDLCSIHLRNMELLLTSPCRHSAVEAGVRFEAFQILGREPTRSELDPLLGSGRKNDLSSAESIRGLDSLRHRFRWPTVTPEDVEPNEACHFTRPQTKAMLTRRLRERRPEIVIEIGTWLGGSARFIADESGAHVIAIDTWLGSEEHQIGTAWDQQHAAHHDVRDRLFDTFSVNCRNYRQVITPLRATSLAGLHEVHSHGIQPGLIFIDGAHDKASVAADLRTAHDLFGKNAWIVLDDYGTGESWLGGLEEAVNEFARERGYQVEHNGGACTLHW